MPTIQVSFHPSHRTSVLAAVTVTLSFEDSTVVEIYDARVMKNRQGVLWAALPTYSVTNGKHYEYLPTIVFPPELHRGVMDAILEGYERYTKPIAAKPEKFDGGANLATPKDAKPFLATRFYESDAAVSPDGRWVVYQSAESGEAEIYVRDFPTAGNRFQVSTDGGFEPVWARNGKELFYRSGKKLISVPVKLGADFVPGA